MGQEVGAIWSLSVWSAIAEKIAADKSAWIGKEGRREERKDRRAINEGSHLHIYSLAFFLSTHSVECHGADGKAVPGAVAQPLGPEHQQGRVDGGGGEDYVGCPPVRRSIVPFLSFPSLCLVVRLCVCFALVALVLPCMNAYHELVLTPLPPSRPPSPPPQ